MDRFAAARGKYITYSPDGIIWDRPLERLKVDGDSDRCLVARDARHGRWWLNNRPPVGYNAAGLATSTDLVNWSATEPVLPRGKAKDHPDVESLVPFNYGNQDLGFLITQIKRPGRTQLASFLVSHHDDGAWTRIANVPNEPFIPAGPPGSHYTNGAVILHNGPIVAGDELLFYFNGFSYDADPPCPKGSRTIGLAKLRRDGFSGLHAASDAGERLGTLTTRPLRLSGHHLYVNVEQRSPAGRLRAAVLDKSGAPLPGFTLDECMPVESDKVRAPVRWREQADIRRLAGREVRLQLELSGGAVLYAFGTTE
jgi:hypothetical protein